MSFVLEGALYQVGEHVLYAGKTHVVISRRRTSVGIEYQLRSEGARPEGHYNVVQAALDPLPRRTMHK